MVRVVIWALALAVSAGAVTTPRNWRGYADTVAITDTLKSGEVHYTAPLRLTDGEDLRVLCKFADTAAAGYASDSIKFRWGYQLGTLTLSSAGVRDTLWDSRIVIDTADVDSLGRDSIGTCVPAGTVTRYWNKHADTTDVSGYAVQDRWIVPEWAPLIRYWAAALTGQRQGKAITLRFEQHQRAYVQMGN